MTVQGQLTSILAGRYTIDRQIGAGGMSLVFLAQDIRHNRRVAVKVLRPELTESVGLDRFLREIAVTARLDHPHILPLIDSGQAEGIAYYVMPFVEGESLRDRLDREKQLPLADALAIATDVADALQYAHANGVVHRDIKPENILLASGHARVADFGIARAVSAAGGSALTMTGVVIGTPAYMSPEQAAGASEIDGRSDIYSVACVLYEMLSGRAPSPFLGAAPAVPPRESLIAVSGIHITRSTIPYHVERTLERALATSPADRFPTAADFSAALTRAHAGVVRRMWDRSPLGVITTAITAVLLTGGIVMATSGERLQPRIDALVVLPFGGQAAAKDDDYFADGLHATLVGELGRVSWLRVTSRNSALRYRGTTKSSEAIAGDLDVDALVEADIFRTAGDSVRVDLRLVQASPEQVLWSRSYTDHASRATSMIGKGADAIARHLQGSETGVRQASAPRRHDVDPKAAEHVARGQYLLRVNLFREARAAFEAAISLDSTYAAAHLGLAQVFNIGGYYSSSVPTQVFPLAQTAARTALQYDPVNSEAYAQLAWAQAVFEWDWEGAERNFRKAISLNPSNENAHFWYSRMLGWQGRVQEAQTELEKTLELDPLAMRYRLSGAMAYRLMGRCDLARRQLEIARQLETEFRIGATGFGGRGYQDGLCDLDAGRHTHAIAKLESGFATSAPDFRLRYKAELVHAYGVAGHTAQGRKLMRELLADREQEYIAPYLIALAYAGLGERDSSFVWLDRGFREKDSWLPFASDEPRWHTLRADPRFADLMKRLKLDRKS